MQAETAEKVCEKSNQKSCLNGVSLKNTAAGAPRGRRNLNCASVKKGDNFCFLAGPIPPPLPIYPTHITPLPISIMTTETQNSSETSLFTHETNRKSSSGLYSGCPGFKFEPTNSYHELIVGFLIHSNPDTPFTNHNTILSYTATPLTHRGTKSHDTQRLAYCL
jgi:hypothetical protein